MKKCIFLLLVCFASSAIWAKCGNSAIVIDGSIPGSVTGSTISVQVVPDPNWDSQPAAIIDANGQFHMTVYFDRTQPGNRERCSRKPKTVTVQLNKNGRLVEEVSLQVKRDFTSKDNTDYHLRSPITLRAR
jgi:hypothetical protein